MDCHGPVGLAMTVNFTEDCHGPLGLAMTVNFSEDCHGPAGLAMTVNFPRVARRLRASQWAAVFRHCEECHDVAVHACNTVVFKRALKFQSNSDRGRAHRPI